MAKVKSIYVCQNCGAKSAKWLGRCPHCGQFGTYQEELEEKAPRRPATADGKKIVPIPLEELEGQQEQRIDTQNDELNRVLGGGLVKGGVVLIGGEPGIGKSTLALQLALNLAGKKILYVSGEESAPQLKLRADRLQAHNPACLIYPENQVEAIIRQAQSLAPELLIIDSIQTLRTDKLESAPGTISQIRESTNSLIAYAKTSEVPVLIIGHINKEGQLAGPKVLEHIVDTVLQFEGHSHQVYRMLRAVKNRFGSTSELALYEMRKEGLIEVANPSEVLITHQGQDLTGVSVAAGLEGIRPMLIETQALVSSAVYGTPQRSATGYDIKRLNMLLAVLEKKAGFRLGVKDVFLNIAGGLKVTDTAIDLALLAAILSSNMEIALPENVCFAGEIGLSGEIRPVARTEQRAIEAEKLGFKTMFISAYTSAPQPKGKLEIRKLRQVADLQDALF